MLLLMDTKSKTNLLTIYIIKQDIPVELFETNDYYWHPSIAIYLAEIEVVGTPDKNLRYQYLLNIFKL